LPLLPQQLVDFADLVQAYVLWISMFRHVDFVQLVDFVDFVDFDF